MNDAEKIAHLEAVVKNRDDMLRSLWTICCDALLLGQQPDEIRRRKAFYTLDKCIRDIGLLP